MIRGTTPVITFNINIARSEIKTIWITFGQNGKELFNLTGGDVVISDYSGEDTSIKAQAKCTLTQEQTIMFDADIYAKVELQLSVFTTSGKSMKTKIFKVPVSDIIREEVIS